MKIEGFRIYFSFYVTAVYYVLLVLKILNRDKILGILVQAGYGEEMRQGLLTSFGNRVYFLGIGVFLLVFFLPQIMRLVGKDGALERCLYVAVIFWLFSLLAWLTTNLDLPYLGFYIVFGGLFGIVEGIRKVPVLPIYLSDEGLSIGAKCELLKFEDTKWWRGLTLFWAVVITGAVAGVLNWVLGPYPSIGDVKRMPGLGKVPGMTFVQGMVMVFSAVPAIALLAWDIIRRTNCIHKKLEDLYKEGINKERRSVRTYRRSCGRAKHLLITLQRLMKNRRIRY